MLRSCAPSLGCAKLFPFTRTRPQTHRTWKRKSSERQDFYLTFPRDSICHGNIEFLDSNKAQEHPISLPCPIVERLLSRHILGSRNLHRFRVSGTGRCGIRAKRRCMANSKSEAKMGAGLPGKVTFLDGRGELPMLEVSTAWSTAEIYVQGAHVTHFKKKNEPPFLFLSQCSRFAEGQPIRGGIPVVFPWFGPREGLSQHGFARLKQWELKEFAPAPDGS